MLKTHAAQRGFTLVEAMITMAVLGILVALGAPGFFEWMQNQRTRAATEGILNGIQVARANSVQQNKAVRIVLAPPAAGWTVYDITGAAIQTSSGQEGTSSANVAVTPNGATTITFGSLGGVIANADASASITQIDVSNSNFTSSGARPLRVVVTGGGSVRMCDPDTLLSSADPRRC